MEPVNFFELSCFFHKLPQRSWSANVSITDTKPENPPGFLVPEFNLWKIKEKTNGFAGLWLAGFRPLPIVCCQLFWDFFFHGFYLSFVGFVG